MAKTKKNFDVFPEQFYVGTNLGFVTASNNILGSLQVKHPNEGIMEFAVSNDYETKEMVDKLWSPISVRLQGTTIFLPSVDFSLVSPDPVMIKFGCFSYAFLKATLTTGGGIFRAVYNVPTRSTDS